MGLQGFWVWVQGYSVLCLGVRDSRLQCSWISWVRVIIFMGLGFRVTMFSWLGFKVTLALGLRFTVWVSGYDWFGVWGLGDSVSGFGV